MRNTRSAHRSSRHSKLLHTGTCSLRFLHQPRYSRGAPDTLHAAGSPPSTGQASCSTRTRRQATLSLRSSPPRGAATAAGAAAATAYMATRMSSRKGGWRCAAPSPARSGGDASPSVWRRTVACLVGGTLRCVAAVAGESGALIPSISGIIGYRLDTRSENGLRLRWRGGPRREASHRR